MPLKSGARLGPYEVVAAIGAGGMGEVYRARDTKLNRDVALKILPATFASDSDRLARFHREAQVLASLNHPHIGAIYGFEESGDTHALVLEFVDGPTLADRIAQGPIPVDEALPIAMQIAEALETAHEQGIIHRDLKPANVKLRPDGTVKVLDFGLAKLNVSNDPNGPNALSMSPTITSPAMMTGVGVLLGTAAYMAPEQARGKTVDKRADIWAFGCVVYEMLSGQRAFAGEDVTDFVVSVVTKEPDWSKVPTSAPVRAMEVLRRCLRKDPRERLRDIGDARIELAESSHAAPVAARESRSRTRLWSAGAAIVVVVAAAFAFIWGRAQADVGAPSWSGAQLGGPTTALGPRISPDGRLVAFQSMVGDTTQVAVMQPDSGDWTVLTHDRNHGYVTDVAWATDGSRLFYGRVDSTPRGVFSISPLGGEERLVLENAKSVEPLPDGSLVVVRVNDQRREQFYRYWPDTGRLEPFPASPIFGDFSRLRVIPGKPEALFVGRALDQPSADSNNYLYHLDLNSGEVRRVAGPDQVRVFAVTPDGASVVYAVRAGDGNMLVQMPINGGAARVLMALTRPPNTLNITRTGELYVDEPNRPLQLLRLDPARARAPSVTTIVNGYFSDFIALGCGRCFAAAPLPDGRVIVPTHTGGRSRLVLTSDQREAAPFVQTMEETAPPVALIGRTEAAFVIGSGSARQVAVASIANGRIVRRLSGIDGGTVTALASSPDGGTVYFVTAGKIWSIPAQGGQAKFVREGDSLAVDPDGRYLIVQLNEADAIRLMRVPLDGQQERALSFPGVAFAYVPITPNAVRRDGTILKALGTSWFWELGLLHPDTGAVERLPLPQLDVHYPGWSADGQIVVSTFPIQSSLWRFTPQRKQ